MPPERTSMTFGDDTPRLAQRAALRMAGVLGSPVFANKAARVALLIALRMDQGALADHLEELEKEGKL